MLSRALIVLLHLYKLCISPLLGQRCRFYPSCSSYAIDAIQTHGSLRGGYLAAKRLLHCHPWHPGGYDPVPNATPIAVASRCSHASCTHAPCTHASTPARSSAHSDLRKKL